MDHLIFQKSRSCIPLALLLAAGLFIVIATIANSTTRTNINSVMDQAFFPHIDITLTNAKTAGNRRLMAGFETGSFSNCSSTMPTSRNSLESLTTLATTNPPHPETSTTVISCRAMHYRAPLPEIEKGGYNIIVGVLSGAGGKGPLHRDSIRSTWAKDRKGVYFIVAGPWEEIVQEYEKYRDLIWIEEEEIYEGEESVLPFKTEAFLHIIHKYSLPGKAGFEYLFKTDDDSYVDLAKLEKNLMIRTQYNYWGCCTQDHFRPLRSPTRKWMVTFELYPEEYYPLYCQGAGFAMSRTFVQCISEHLKDFRYNPFEDVSVGLLAERCGMPPVSDYAKIKQYRTQDASELKQVNNEKREEIFFLPRATMKGKVLQHRVKTHYDMYAHHRCALEGC